MGFVDVVKRPTSISHHHPFFDFFTDAFRQSLGRVLVSLPIGEKALRLMAGLCLLYMVYVSEDVVFIELSSVGL
jgi:hypothetical protein